MKMNMPSQDENELRDLIIEIDHQIDRSKSASEIICLRQKRMEILEYLDCVAQNRDYTSPGSQCHN
jgi:hypothetical protein